MKPLSPRAKKVVEKLFAAHRLIGTIATSAASDDLQTLFRLFNIRFEPISPDLLDEVSEKYRLNELEFFSGWGVAVGREVDPKALWHAYQRWLKSLDEAPQEREVYPQYDT